MNNVVYLCLFLSLSFVVMLCFLTQYRLVVLSLGISELSKVKTKTNTKNKKSWQSVQKRKQDQLKRNDDGTKGK
jgi:rRNA-processing protein FCF1